MYKNIHTDLAVEVTELHREKAKSTIPGVNVEEHMADDIKITDVNIVTDEGAQMMGKDIGRYLTVEMPDFVHYDGDSMDRVSKEVAKWLTPLVQLDDKDKVALVVGLGNWNITPDAIGPQVMGKIMVTRHLKELVPDKIDENIRPVCGISPGVLGLTGIETVEIIRGVIERVKPDLVIAVDALSSRKMERVNRTIQITDTGISPGAGIGNNRMKLNKDTLGIPVIAMGVPTVVHAATLANDTIDLVVEEMKKYSTKGSLMNFLEGVESREKERMIREVLNPFVGDLMVTPKEVDMVIESMSKIIANGINISLQPALDLDDINSFLN